MKRGGNYKSSVRKLPSLNCLFQTVRPGAPSESTTTEGTVSPIVLSANSERILHAPYRELRRVTQSII